MPRPGALNYGSAGTGSGAHMGAELFRYLTKVNIAHVPYKGSAPPSPTPSQARCR